MTVARSNAPGAFPLFADGRHPTVVTADPWSFLRHLASERLPKGREQIALAYLDQALDFFDATSNPRLGSKPLLYYYSFLNLVKAALVIQRVTLPPKVGHGISDPRANAKKRIRFSGQRIQWDGQAVDHSALFPELLALLTGASAPSGSRSIRDLLQQIPAVHRTFCRVTGTKNLFLPITRVHLKQAAGQVWAQFVVRRADGDADKTLDRVSRRRAFAQLLKKVRPENDEELVYESEAVPGAKKGLDNGIRALTARLKPLALSTILTHQGYRLYFTDIAPARRLPQLAAVYAVMFYLGSITRYKPYDFDRIVRGGESWIVNEFFATQPIQVLHVLSSTLAGCAVTRPYAASG